MRDIRASRLGVGGSIPRQRLNVRVRRRKRSQFADPAGVFRVAPTKSNLREDAVRDRQNGVDI